MSFPDLGCPMIKIIPFQLQFQAGNWIPEFHHVFHLLIKLEHFISFFHDHETIPFRSFYLLFQVEFQQTHQSEYPKIMNPSQNSGRCIRSKFINHNIQSSCFPIFPMKNHPFLWALSPTGWQCPHLALQRDAAAVQRLRRLLKHRHQAATWVFRAKKNAGFGDLSWFIFIGSSGWIII